MYPQSNIVMSWLNQMNLILFSVEKNYGILLTYCLGIEHKCAHLNMLQTC